jgi:hypothetical protein
VGSGESTLITSMQPASRRHQGRAGPPPPPLPRGPGAAHDAYYPPPPPHYPHHPSQQQQYQEGQGPGPGPGQGYEQYQRQHRQFQRQEAAAAEGLRRNERVIRALQEEQHQQQQQAPQTPVPGARSHQGQRQGQSVHDELVRQLSHLRGGPGGSGGAQGQSAARRRGTDVPLPAAAVPRRDTSPHRYLRHNRYFFDG